MITNNFSLRLATTLMGILFTDTFFAHQHFNAELAEFKEELGKLAYRLMHNPFAPDPTPPPSPQTGRGSGSPTSPQPDGNHPLMQLSKLYGHGMEQVMILLHMLMEPNILHLDKGFLLVQLELMEPLGQ